MSDELKPRVRINAKQTSKGDWYLDVTAETDNVDGSVNFLTEAIDKTRRSFIESGKQLTDLAG